MSRAATVPRGHPAIRRVAAFVLSLVAPGLGHVALGRSARAIGWGVALLAGLALTVGAGLAALPLAFWACFAQAALLRVAATVDALTLPAADPLPRLWPRVVLGAALVACALATDAAATRTFEALGIPSSSMHPSLPAGDRVLVRRVASRPARGDVYVFRNPHAPTNRFMKRVIALGGDTIAMQNGTVVVNDRTVERSMTAETCTVSAPAACRIEREQLGPREYRVTHTAGLLPGDFPAHRVKEGHLFFLGDNRELSEDSRTLGDIPERYLVGRVLFVYATTRADGTLRPAARRIDE